MFAESALNLQTDNTQTHIYHINNDTNVHHIINNDDDFNKYKTKKYHHKCQQKLLEMKQNSGKDWMCPIRYEKYMQTFDVGSYLENKRHYLELIKISDLDLISKYDAMYDFAFGESQVGGLCSFKINKEELSPYEFILKKAESIKHATKHNIMYIYIPNRETICELKEYIKYLPNAVIVHVFTPDYIYLNNWIINHKLNTNIIIHKLTFRSGSIESRHLYNEIIGGYSLYRINTDEKIKLFKTKKESINNCSKQIEYILKEKKSDIQNCDQLLWWKSFKNKKLAQNIDAFKKDPINERGYTFFKEIDNLCFSIRKLNESSSSQCTYTDLKILLDSFSDQDIMMIKNKIIMIIDLLDYGINKIKCDEYKFLNYDKNSMIRYNINTFIKKNNFVVSDEIIIVDDITSDNSLIYQYDDPIYDIPKIIHYIWVGGIMPEKRIASLVETATEATKKNYQIYLWTDKITMFRDSLKLIFEPEINKMVLSEKTNKVFAGRRIDEIEKLVTVKIIDSEVSTIEKQLYTDATILLQSIIDNKTNYELLVSDTSEPLPIYILFDNHMKKMTALETLHTGVKNLYANSTSSKKNYALYADYIRLVLLYIYGGCYIDVDCTPHYMYQTDKMYSEITAPALSPFMATANTNTPPRSNNILAAIAHTDDLYNCIVDALIRMSMFSVMDIGEYQQKQVSPIILYKRNKNEQIKLQSLSFMNAARDTVKGQFKILSGNTKLMPAIKRATLDMFGPSVASNLANKYEYGTLPAGGSSGEILTACHTILMTSMLQGV